MLILAKISKLYPLAKFQPAHGLLINLFHQDSDSIGFGQQIVRRKRATAHLRFQIGLFLLQTRDLLV